MTNTVKFERLAELKAQIKILEVGVKELQQELIVDGGAEKVETSLGTLSLTTRTTMECLDKQKLFDEVGQKTYLAFSSAPHGAVKKVCGEFQTDMLTGAGHFAVKSVSKYYILRSK